MPLPWSRLALLVPTVVQLSRELRERKQAARGEPLRGLEARVAAVEEAQRREAELVQALAEQSAALAEAAETLRRQTRIVWGIASAAAAVAAAALLIALLR